MQEKSKGVLLFAFNTAQVDYVKIADRAAQLIHHTLNLPVALVTDNTTKPAHVDTIITVENTLQNFRTGYAGGTPWRNGNRFLAYELSPYDETILIDSDYLMLDSTLLTVLATTHDYRLIHNNQSPEQYMTNTIGATSIEHVWATAITFKRTIRSQLLFELAGRIQQNYEYYCNLYNITVRNFRNDYAFAIAHNILSGYTLDKVQGMPFTMLTLDKTVTALEWRANNLVARYQDRAYILPHQNIHVMDKDYLLSDNFQQFVDTVCKN